MARNEPCPAGSTLAPRTTVISEFRRRHLAALSTLFVQVLQLCEQAGLVKLGHVALIDYVALEDCGRIINPMTLRGQVIGALVQGLGGAFLEDLVYDEHGQFLTGSLADYLVPTASDFPNLRAVVLESHPSPINPLGAKGAGEGGIIPVGGVIANAVANALASLGVEPRELPLSPSRIWHLARDARQRRAAQ